jgi:hypothetical protein
LRTKKYSPRRNCTSSRWRDDRVLRDQLVDHDDRLVDAAELVERARLLVEHLVVVRIVRILGEDLVVELDRLERTLGRLCCPAAQRAGALFGSAAISPAARFSNAWSDSEGFSPRFGFAGARAFSRRAAWPARARPSPGSSRRRGSRTPSRA